MKTFNLNDISFQCNCKQTTLINKPSLELSAPDAGVFVLEFVLVRPDSFFLFFLGLAGLSAGVIARVFLL